MRKNTKANTLLLFLATTVLAIPSALAASKPFSAEQLKELAKILAKHDECIRAQVKAEVLNRPKPKDMDCDLSAIAVVSGEADSPVESAEPIPVAAQASSPAIPNPAVSSAAAMFFEKTGDSTIDRDAGNAQSKFEITATTESSKASINVSRDISAATNNGVGTFSSLSLALSAPVSKTGSTTNIATLDGFANSSTLTVGYHKFFVYGLRTPVMDDGTLSPGFEAICAAAGINIDKESCDSASVKAGLVKADRMDLYPTFVGYFFDPNALKWTYGAKATVGRESYDFFNATSLASQKDQKGPWSLGAYAGLVPPLTNAFLSAGVEFQHAYMPRKAKVVCPSSTGASQIQCVNGSIGAPQATDKHLVYADGRADLGFAAIDLRVTHDFASGDNGVDLPIYLFRDTKSTWTGGLRLGWTNTDQFSLGIFVGSSFGLLP
jgi:hypothetical protein